MKWDSPYRKWALPAGKKKNQYSLMKRRLIGIEQMKPSFHTKKRLKEGGTSANVILSSKIHVSTVGRTEDKNNWSSLELYWASFINRHMQLPVPVRSCGQQNGKLTNIKHLICLETLTQKSLLSLILGNRIFKRDQVQKRETDKWSGRKEKTGKKSLKMLVWRQL